MWVVPGSLVVCVTAIWGACLKGMCFGYDLLLWGMLTGWISLATGGANGYTAWKSPQIRPTRPPKRPTPNDWVSLLISAVAPGPERYSLPSLPPGRDPGRRENWPRARFHSHHEA